MTSEIEGRHQERILGAGEIGAGPALGPGVLGDLFDGEGADGLEHAHGVRECADGKDDRGARGLVLAVAGNIDEHLPPTGEPPQRRLVDLHRVDPVERNGLPAPLGETVLKIELAGFESRGEPPTLVEDSVEPRGGADEERDEARDGRREHHGDDGDDEHGQRRPIERRSRDGPRDGNRRYEQASAVRVGFRACSERCLGRLGCPCRCAHLRRVVCGRLGGASGFANGAEDLLAQACRFRTAKEFDGDNRIGPACRLHTSEDPGDERFDDIDSLHAFEVCGPCRPSDEAVAEDYLILCEAEALGAPPRNRRGP